MSQLVKVLNSSLKYCNYSPF